MQLSNGITIEVLPTQEIIAKEENITAMIEASEAIAKVNNNTETTGDIDDTNSEIFNSKRIEDINAIDLNLASSTSSHQNVVDNCILINNSDESDKIDEKYQTLESTTTNEQNNCITTDASITTLNSIELHQIKTINE